jgi:hypothetical protein
VKRKKIKKLKKSSIFGTIFSVFNGKFPPNDILGKLSEKEFFSEKTIFSMSNGNLLLLCENFYEFFALKEK